MSALEGNQAKTMLLVIEAFMTASERARCLVRHLTSATIGPLIISAGR
jgi:hypothetical protein